MQSKEVISLFRKIINSKKYKDAFGYSCFFGSLNLKTDLDLFIIPATKKGKFLKMLVLFLKDIRRELRKRKYDIVVVPHSTFEEEVRYISKIRSKQIQLHISSFPDIHPVPIKTLLPKLRKPKFVLTGSYNALNKMKKTKLDYHYNYLFLANCLLSNYPKRLEREKITNKVNHIYKHVVGKKKELTGTTEKIYFNCCDFLDGKAY